MEGHRPVSGPGMRNVRRKFPFPREKMDKQRGFRGTHWTLETCPTRLEDRILLIPDGCERDRYGFVTLDKNEGRLAGLEAYFW